MSNISDSKGALSMAAKDLFARWNDVKTVWSDTQSQEFEATYLMAIEQDVRAALAAMDNLNHVLQAIDHECE